MPGCGKRFKRKFTLQEHLHTHTGLRPFQCDVEGCHRRFSTHGNLNRHKLIHNNDKPFECSDCDKRFCSREKLNRHVKTHMSDRPFECVACERTYSTLGNLTRHQKRHSQQDLFVFDHEFETSMIHDEILASLHGIEMEGHVNALPSVEALENSPPQVTSNDDDLRWFLDPCQMDFKFSHLNH
jgi:uncharacterized Zn-finger protein